MSDGQSEPQMTVGGAETLALCNPTWPGQGPLTKSTPEIDLNEYEARVIWAVQD